MNELGLQELLFTAGVIALYWIFNRSRGREKPGHVKLDKLIGDAGFYKPLAVHLAFDEDSQPLVTLTGGFHAGRGIAHLCLDAKQAAYLASLLRIAAAPGRNLAEARMNVPGADAAQRRLGSRDS